MTDIITTVYDIPMDDIECYERYLKLNWVYDTGRLLDSQKISWSPYSTLDKTHYIPSSMLDQELFPVVNVEGSVHKKELGAIFIEKPEGPRVFTDVILQKGDIKWMKSHNGGFIDENLGDVDLRIQAFIVLYFKRFNGCISFETIGNQIYACHLRPTVSIVESYPEEAKVLLKKVYNKRKVNESIKGIAR